MHFIKKNISLVLGLSIPVVMILFVAGSIYLPGLFVKPHFDFLYMINDNRYNEQQFSVENGLLVRNSIIPKPSTAARPSPRFFIHDVTTNKSREITFEQAQQLKLDSSPQSPDGLSVKPGSRGGSFLFFFGGGGNDYSSRYLVGNGLSKKLNLDIDQGSPYYSNNFRLLGWIIP